MNTKQTVLFSDYAAPPPRPEARQNTIAAALAAARHPARDLRFATQLRVQAAWVPHAWWAGLAAVLAVAGLLLCLPGLAGLFGQLAVLAALGPVLVAMAAPQLAKSHTHGMAELEAATPLPLARLSALRLAVLGGACLPVLALALILGGRGVWLPLALAALAVPFFLSAALCFLLLGLVRGIGGSLAAIGAAALIAFLALASAATLEAPLAAALTARPTALLAPLLWACAGTLLVFLACLWFYLYIQTEKRRPHAADIG